MAKFVFRLGVWEPGFGRVNTRKVQKFEVRYSGIFKDNDATFGGITVDIAVWYIKTGSPGYVLGDIVEAA